MVSFTIFKGSKEGKIVQSTTTKELKRGEVLIKITHSGLCGTDEHYRHADMCLGHEGAGVIEELGPEVTKFAKGDSVGWGYIHNSCGDCKQCLTGHEPTCPKAEMYGLADFDQGSFASHAIWKANFVFKIPDSLDRSSAAPLMCGGATVFGALMNGNIRPTDRVGVIGIGGLGHLAIQFAAKMGCEVVVFSSTDNKKEESFKLGASEFIATKGVETFQISEPIDHLLVTTSFQPDWSKFIPIMAPQGKVYPLSVASGELVIPYMPWLSRELRIIGSVVAGRQVHKEMLEFAAHNNVKAIIEEFPMTVQGIEESMAKLERGEMRYRGVLVAQ